MTRIRHLLLDLTSRERHLVGASAARILVGLTGAHFFISGWSHRAALWGPDSYLAGGGLVPPGRARGPSLFDLPTSTLAFDVLFGLGLVVAVGFAVFGGRALAIGHAALFWSITERNPNLFDGGDAFARIAAILLVFAVTDASLAPGVARRRARLRARGSGLRATAHNAAVLLIGFQIAVVYATAGLWKVSSPIWREGTALWSIAQLEDYRFLPAVSELYSEPILVAVLTYAVIGIEVAFVPALFTRLRVPVVGAAALMHAGIAATMGLVGFALGMWAGLAVCLPDRDYARLGVRPPDRDPPPGPKAPDVQRTGRSRSARSRLPTAHNARRVLHPSPRWSSYTLRGSGGRWSSWRGRAT